jgi:nucleoside-diphosphate-sugar epimerase
MRVVITGASGNVGTALLRVLPAEHHVVGVVRRPPVQQGVYQRASWCSVDLTEENAIAELRQVFDGADVVVHLAWGFQPTRDTRYLTRLGVGGTSAVLQAAHAASVGHLVHMSSVGTYAAGSYGMRVDESWPTTGIQSSPYSRDKSAAEVILDEYEQRLGNAAIPIARMRPGFILQRAAASGLMRYALPGYVPMQLVPWLPLLPLDRRLCIPLVHADDVCRGDIAGYRETRCGPVQPCCRTADRTRRCSGRARRAAGSHPLRCARSSRRAELASTAATYRPRLARPGVHRASTGLLPGPRRTQLGSEMVLDGRLGRSPGWRRAPNSRRQSTFAATLDA